ncbi:MAG TPA: 4Fe-4S dicluster domain-containing protein [Candidatus Lokiarchaeia archaeon]|nr:4Fe-4S dicluster domain-containing protein [Candidatus Lokiarchaeia archaeon]
MTQAKNTSIELQAKDFPFVGVPYQQRPQGVFIYIDPKKCTACGLCAEVCPFGLPEQAIDGKYQVYEVERCVECSACQRNCPAGAIQMQEIQGCGCLWDAAQRKKGGSGCC